MIGERPFAEIRKRSGRSAGCAAALLRISESHLRRLERGRLPLTLPLAEKMCVVYDVDLNELVRGWPREAR